MTATRLDRTTIGTRAVVLGGLFASIYILPPAVYLGGLSALVVAWILWRYLRRFDELISLRNIFLIGFVFFQLYSVATVAGSHDSGQFVLAHPLADERRFALLSTVFLTVFLLAYSQSVFPRRIRHRPVSALRHAVPHRPAPAMALALTLGGGLLRVYAVVAPHGALGHAASAVAVAVAAVACGLAAWIPPEAKALSRRAIFCLLIVVANIPVAVVGQFSRRPLTALFGAVLWSLYYSRLRRRGSRRTIVRLIALAAIPIFAVGAFTSLRSAGKSTTSISGFLNGLTDTGGSGAGIKSLATNLPTGAVTLWVEENYPKYFKARRFQSAEYFFGVVVPRGLWRGKPKPISQVVPTEADLQGVNLAKIKVPAGVIGNAAAEGGMLADILYAALIALLLKYFDVTTLLYRRDPLVVVAIGSSLGQVLGMARGETSVFATVFVGSVLITRLALAGLAAVIAYGRGPEAVGSGATRTLESIRRAAG